MNKILDIVEKIFKIVFFISFFVGGIVVLIYCIRIGYMPAGIGVGDSLFFIAIAMWFSFIYVLYFGCISATSLLVVWVVKLPINRIFSLSKALFNCKERRINEFDWSLYPLLLGGLIFALALYKVIDLPELRGFVTSTGYLVVAISVSLVVSLIIHQDLEALFNAIRRNLESLKGCWKRYVMIIPLLVIFFSPLVVYPEISKQMSKAAFGGLGVSVKNAEIYLDRKKEPLFYGGETTVSNDHLILKDVDILWTGVGNGTVIEIKINNEPRKYVLKTSEILFSY